MAAEPQPAAEGLAPPSPRRVLQVSAFFSAHGGGIEVVAGKLAHQLAASGVRVLWMAGGPRNERPAGPLPSGMEIDQAGSADLLEHRLGLPFPLWGLRSVVRLWRHAGGADVVHVHDYLYVPSLLAAAFAKLRGKPVVVTQHVGDIPFRSTAARALLGGLNRSLGRLVLACANQAVFVGRPVQEYFARFVRFRRAPLLIANGVDHQRYHPVHRSCAKPRPVHVLFVGRFVEKKGIALLRGCVDLPNTRWTFIGRGPLSPGDWEVPGSDMDVLGALPAEMVVPHYQQADLLVLPSTGEGFPLVVQEALACGTPVLVSREVAAAFPATNSRCVFDVELRVPDPARALRDALEALVSQPALLHEARGHAGALAAQWSWDTCASQYLATYRAVLRQ